MLFFFLPNFIKLKSFFSKIEFETVIFLGKLLLYFNIYTNRKLFKFFNSAIT